MTRYVPWGRGRFTAHGSETCQHCDLPVGVWWTATDELWATVTGRNDGGGVLCMGCFDVIADMQGLTLRWSPTHYPNRRADA